MILIRSKKTRWNFVEDTWVSVFSLQMKAIVQNFNKIEEQGKFDVFNEGFRK